MMPGLRAELDRLLSILVDDELSEADHARLEELLRNDEECRRFYLEYVDLHVRLTHHPKLAALLEEVPEPVAAPPSMTPVVSRARPLWLPLMVTAALTLAASWAVQLFVSAPKPADPGAVGLSQAVAQAPAIVPSYVATLSKNVACVWEGDEPLRSGMRLLPGVIRLRSGTAELQFDGGAQLVLAGPVELNVESVTSAAVVSGKVLFRSDDTAEPFDLHTPMARLVDYGTEYAVEVGKTGEEVHVFDGEVRRSPRPAAEPETELALNSVSVMAGEARRFLACDDVQGCSVPLDAGRLRIRASAPAAAESAHRQSAGELLAYEPFACDAAVLPCSGAGLGGIGFTTPWVKACKSEFVPEFRIVNSLWRPQMNSATEGGGVSAGCRGAMSRRLARPIRMDEDGVYYFSYLIRSEKRAGDGSCDVQFILRDHLVHEPQRKLAVSASWSSSKTSLCWEGGGNCASIPVEPGKTYLMAGKIVAGREAPDQAFLCLFMPRQPVPSAEPSSWTLASRPVLSDLKFDVVQISANTATPVLVDELRIGTSWAAVAGVFAAP
ncbi:MAG: hypothetical protein C0483_12450 [Pirellula sp.]|nr:hypothetical protein [Pirellula sp.]